MQKRCGRYSLEAIAGERRLAKDEIRMPGPIDSGTDVEVTEARMVVKRKIDRSRQD